MAVRPDEQCARSSSRSSYQTWLHIVWYYREGETHTNTLPLRLCTTGQMSSVSGVAVHCKNSGVQCTPNHLHTYGVLTHLLLKVCNTHQIFGLLKHTVTEGVHYTPNIWCAKHTLSLKVCITHQTFSVLTHCVTEGVYYTPSVLNTPCH